MTHKYPFWIILLKKLYVRFGHLILPKWAIFSFDIAVVFVLAFVAFLIRLNFSFAHLQFDKVLGMAVFVTSIYGLFFLYMQTYSGIIRHTGFYDILKLFRATASASVFIAFVAAIASWEGNRPGFLPPFSVLLIHVFLTMSILSISRFFVRAVFQHIIRTYKGKRTNVLIFGAGVSGRITRTTLNTDLQTNYKVLAFLDDNPAIEGKFIEGIPVFTPERYFLNGKLKWEQGTNGNSPDLLVIAIQHLSPERRRQVMEMALTNKMEVKAVPPVINWINGSLSATQLRKVRIEELLVRPKIELYSESVSQSISNRVVMITGAAGSIGSEIARQVLKHKPQRLLLFDQAESGLFDLEFALKNDPALKAHAHLAKTVVGSVCDPVFLESTIAEHKPELIYHAAAYKHVPLMEENPYMAVMTNVFGTRNLVDMAVKHRCRKMVFVSTDKAVNPSSVMGASKRIAEMYAQCHNSCDTSFITTRFGNVLDSNGSVTQIFQKQLDAGGPLTVTHKEIYRYFMLIPEACSLVLEAGVMGNGGEIFIFDMGDLVKIYDLALNMILLNGLVPDKDIKIEITGLRPGEKLFEELLTDKESTLPTHHPKILKAKASAVTLELLNAHLNQLHQIALSGDKDSIVGKMMQIVEEYVPQNSVFAAINGNGDSKKVNNNVLEVSEQPVSDHQP